VFVRCSISLSGSRPTAYAAIQAALNASQNFVVIDFTGLDIVTPSFLNTSFRVLAKQHDYDFLKTRLRIVGGNKCQRRCKNPHSAG